MQTVDASKVEMCSKRRISLLFFQGDLPMFPVDFAANNTSSQEVEPAPR